MSELAGVLWDLDGTLVDTEPYWIEAEQAFVTEHGGSWTTAQAHALVGHPLLLSAAQLRAHVGADVPDRVIVESLQAHVVGRVGAQPPWRPGAWELLAELREAGVRCALVTMAWAALADAVLAQLPAGSFDAVVTGDQVHRGKPYPEPYRLGLTRLALPASVCVAIEDSVPGLTSAESAGLPSVAVPHAVPVPPAPGRTLVGSLVEVDLAFLRRVRTAVPPQWNPSAP